MEFIIAIILVIVICTIAGKKKKNDELDLDKNTGSTTFKIVFSIIIILAGIFFAYTNHHGPIIEDLSYSSVADGFTIDKYNVELDVKKDNKVDVTETIYINFYEDGHHGIYKFIPTWLKYTGKDGDTISRQSKISNLKTVGKDYTIDSVGRDKERIKIGSPYETLEPGIYKYIISYTYDMGDDPFNGFDEFIFHAYGDFWGTQIKNPTIEVTLPEEIHSEVNFFADKYRNNRINDYVDYRIDSRTIYATVKDSYALNKSLTIDIELPEGYFNNSSNLKMTVSIIACSLSLLILIVITLILFNRWKKYGEDPQKKVETVEFYPPEKLDPAQLAYIYKRETGKKLTISLIVSLASKGYIKIDENEDKKIVITNNYVNLSSQAYRRIKAVKLKDYVQNDENKDVMEAYFSNNKKEISLDTTHDEDVTTVSDKITVFLEVAKELIDKGYISITEDIIYYPETDTMKKYDEYLEDNKEIKLSHAERIVYNYIFKDEHKEVILENNTKFYQAFSEVNNFISSDIENRIKDRNSYREMSKSATLYIINSIILALTMYFATMYNNQLYIIIICITALVLNIIGLILTILTKRKTDYAADMQAKINGFKNYLNLAEKDQLEQEVNKNPHYFYDILPYAYVLGVSKKWIDKFEKLNIPFPKQEGISFYDYDTFDHISNSITYPVSSSSSSSSSGCSSCGGGCSSCGGGCSSCGGGGSW